MEIFFVNLHMCHVFSFLQNQFRKVRRTLSCWDRLCEWTGQLTIIFVRNILMWCWIGTCVILCTNGFRLVCVWFLPFLSVCYSGVCAEPGGVLFSRRTKYNGPYNPGDQVTYSCFHGEGGATITCQRSGTWSQMPICSSNIFLLGITHLSLFLTKSVSGVF